MAAKKDKMLKDFLAQPLKVGDSVNVKYGLLYEYARDPEHIVSVKVKEVYDDGSIMVENTETYRSSVVLKEGDYTRNTYRVGANPFPVKAWNSDLRTSNYDIANIMMLLGIDGMRSGKPGLRDREYITNGISVDEVNDNPYIIDKDGNKQYYQRDYCWTVGQEQLFIESIYQSIDCGMIVLRKRSYKYIETEAAKGNTELGFFDIVDGKQRFHCIKRFLFDEFQDRYGNYYSDLSDYAKHEFMDSRVLTWGELGPNATDEDVIATFLGVNFTGVPMSQEHIDYVKEIQKKM